MPKIQYREWNPQAATAILIDDIVEVIEEYEAQGFDLTVRQVYYQMVARGFIENSMRSYKRLCGIIDRARTAGLIDWDTIVDRTRRVELISAWDSEPQILTAVGQQFQRDLWATQDHRFEVWVEKEALAGVFGRVCKDLHLPLLACRGYLSSSAMWRAARRLERYSLEGQSVTILHFGDHDASGIDMTRDNDTRQEFYRHEGDYVAVERLALTMAQVEEYEPVPNPAKQTDPRAADYCQKYGDESWELDALPPAALEALVRDRVMKSRDTVAWEKAEQKDDRSRTQLAAVATRWADVVEFLDV